MPSAFLDGGGYKDVKQDSHFYTNNFSTKQKVPTVLRKFQHQRQRSQGSNWCQQGRVWEETALKPGHQNSQDLVRKAAPQEEAVGQAVQQIAPLASVFPTGG